MKKRILKPIALLLAVLMVVMSAPLHFGTGLQADAAVEQETKYLFEKVTTLGKSDKDSDFVIVVKMGEKYYAVQIVDAEVENIDPKVLPTPANAATKLNVNTATTRDVTNMIINDNDKSYLVGVDDTVIWNANNWIEGGGISGKPYCNKGVSFVSKIDPNRYLYMGQVDNNYKKASGTYGLWTINQNTRGFNYNLKGTTGELFSYGEGNYNYFLQFLEETDKATGMSYYKFWNYAESYSTYTSSHAAEVLLFKADPKTSKSITVDKYTNDATPIADKYIEYKWNYKGDLGAYQIVYKSSALGFGSETVPVFIPSDTLQAGHSYIFAAGENTLRYDLQTCKFVGTGGEAAEVDNEANTLPISLYDDFLVDGGSYWVCNAENAANRQFSFYYEDTNKVKNYLINNNYALVTNKSTKGYWTDKNGMIRGYSDDTRLYFDGEGWMLLETLGNVKFYDVAFAQKEYHPATCIEPEYHLYKFNLNGKNYEYKQFTDNPDLDPTNHFSKKVDSSKTADPTCVRYGYIGALICEACNNPCGYEKYIEPLTDVSAHSLGFVANGNGTHAHKCINTDYEGNYCTYVVSGEEALTCVDENKDCICDKCGYLAHTPNVETVTCTVAKVCTVCGTTLEKALGHLVGTTCEDLGNGTHGYMCSRENCGEAVTSESCYDGNSNCLCDVCGSQFEHVAGAAATCLTAQKCIVCGTELVPAKGHNFAGTVRVNKDSTHSFKCKNGCGSYGIMDGDTAVLNGKANCYDTTNDCKCDECAYQLPHTPSDAATCLTPQLCTNCNAVIVAATGHDFSGTAESDGKGNHRIKCKNPGCEVYSEAVVCTKSTIDCKCTVCGYQFAHDYNAENATCSAAKYCKICGHEEVAMLNHEYTFVSVANTRANGDGTHSFKCINGCSNYSGAEACYDSPEDNDCVCDKCGYQMAHTPEEGKAATCEEDVLCTVCGGVAIAKLGHLYSTVATGDGNGHHSGNCTRPGCGKTGTVEDCADKNKDCECDVCGYKLPHVFNVEAATCEESKYCVNCDYVVQEQLDHSYTGTVRNNGNGTHSFMCENGCGKYGGKVSCVDEGEKNCICDICDYSIPHVSGGKATCEQDEVCTNCGTVLKEKLGHDFTSSAATFVSNGEGKHGVKCSRCDAMDSVEDCQRSTIDCTCDKCGYEFEHIAGEPSTCLNPQRCTVCKTQLAVKLQHDYSGEAKSNLDGTHSYLCKNGCNGYGNRTACVKSADNKCRCAECGYQFDHVVVVSEAVAPTCTETGLTEGRVCSVCKTVLLRQETVPATNHKNAYVVEGKAATCTEDGISDGKYCPDCESWLVEQKPLEKLNHEYVTDPAVAPTCTETGLTEGSHCKNCGDVKVEQQIIEKTGHNFGVTVLRNNCQTEGILLYTCKVCGYSYYGDSVPAGHYDNNDDGYCDSCGLDLGTHDHGAKDCSCICHSSNAFSRFIYKIVLVFWKLFKTNKTCACGAVHY